jgi:hypothetical protein
MIPAFAVKADHVDVTARIADRLIKLRLTDKPGMEADQLEIVVSDHDGALTLPRIGATLEVALGWRGETLTNKGSFAVDEVVHSGPPDTITIRARSADFGGSLKEQREEAYDRRTLGDILTTIARRHDLVAAVETGLASIPIPHIDQTNESDANFITRLGQDYDALATIKAGHLIFVPIGHRLTFGGKVIPAAHIARHDGDRHQYKMADRDGSVTGVKAKWRDLAASQTRTALAGTDDGSVKTLKRDYPGKDEALAGATAELARLNRERREIRLSLAQGRPDMIANQRLHVSFFHPEIDGTPWLIYNVTHTIADNGYTNEVEAKALPE